MKHLKAKTKRARTLQGISKYTRGIFMGAVIVIGLNSNGYVIKVGVIPNTIAMTAEAMK